MKASLQTPTSSNKTTALPNQPALPTFMDHIHELRSRLFWIAIIFLVATIAAFPFVDAIIGVLIAPLKGQELYYLTPVGGFSFLIKICMYAGIVVSTPAIIFHLYRYLQPAIGQVNRLALFGYVIFSAILASAGAVFAYYVSLPAALYFLTGLEVTGVAAMLTIDSYYSFVTTYIIGAAILFQVPLILLIINSVTPLRPSKLMGYQKHVILGAFILAAIISPTPDMTNQALLAVPVIIMYQIGIVLVWIRNLTKKSHAATKNRRFGSDVAGQQHGMEQNRELDEQLAWIDDLFESEGDEATHQPAASLIDIETSPMSIVPIAAPVVVPAKPLPVEFPKTEMNANIHRVRTPSRGYAMDFKGVQRAAHLNKRPLPQVKRALPLSQPDPFTSSLKKEVPAIGKVPPRYIDGVSVPAQSIF